ncbi:nuclease [Streptomyces sp. ODS28]|uniref:nuclease n=1 Tax=Streptomyces sp. ODS28 TaxID=3136688 RepID=UPI0031EADF0C
MPMLVIKGSYRVLGASPDGDSIRFYPDHPQEWGKVPGGVRHNRGGGAQLRLDAIDALETHYRPQHGRELHQPHEFGDKASAELLSWLGFSGVERDQAGIVTHAEPQSTPGYILTRGADMYGRCVSLAGRGDAPGRSGSEVTAGVDLLRRTVNYHQIAEGLAYPTYYRKLYVDLREALTDAVHQAQEAGKGLWPEDVTERGAKVQGIASLTDSDVILPKLFRRLADYLALNDGDASLDGFKSYLEQRGDRLFIISNGQSTGFGTVVDVTGDTVRLNRPPTDLVFEEK